LYRPDLRIGVNGLHSDQLDALLPVLERIQLELDTRRALELNIETRCCAMHRDAD
jgi:hypothetical protein